MPAIIAMTGGFVERRRFSRVEQAIEQINRPDGQAQYQSSGRPQRKREAVSEKALPENGDQGRIQTEQVGPQPERNEAFLRFRRHPNSTVRGWAWERQVSGRSWAEPPWENCSRIFRKGVQHEDCLANC